MCNKLLIPYVFPEAIQDFYEMITYQIWKKRKKTQNKTLLSIESNASYGKGLMRPSPGFLLDSGMWVPFSTWRCSIFFTLPSRTVIFLLQNLKGVGCSVSGWFVHLVTAAEWSGCVSSLVRPDCRVSSQFIVRGRQAESGGLLKSCQMDCFWPTSTKQLCACVCIQINSLELEPTVCKSSTRKGLS